MSHTRNILALLAASTLAGTAGAGMITMTADKNAVGQDDWAAYSGYSMVLTIDCSTLNDSGSAATFTLDSWDFAAFDASNTMRFHATGGSEQFTASSGSGLFKAVIGLSSANIDKNDFIPQVESIAFTYAFGGTESLGAAINASANTADGTLQWLYADRRTGRVWCQGAVE